MNITRKNNRVTGKHIYISKLTKKRIKEGSKLHKQLEKVYIPPAYKNVEMSSNPKEKIQAIGLDTKNRKQYIYNKDYIEKQKVIKFKDLIHFGMRIKRIRRDILKILESCENNNSRVNSRNCVIALIIYLIDKCNFRVGNEKYKKLYNSYGVTTLNSNHLKKLTNSYKIKFIGKKGVVNKSVVKNKMVIKLLDNLCSIYGNQEYLFCYFDEKTNNTYRINEKHINDFLKKYHNTISVKMFRTWTANHILLRELMVLDIPDNAKDATKNINIAITKAASNMHHTKNVSKKSYMNNELIELYLNNFKLFEKKILSLKKPNGNFPTIDRLLNLILKDL